MVDGGYLINENCVYVKPLVIAQAAITYIYQDQKLEAIELQDVRTHSTTKHHSDCNGQP